MTQQPHETPEFQHAAEFTIAVTFVVAGGKRPRTANGRARRIFAQIASYTARLGHVVEVTATGGPSHRGTVTWPSPIAFSAANTDAAPAGKPDRFYRYLDPERDRALRSLAEANAAQRVRKEADRQRRSTVGCANTHPSIFNGPRTCRCVYCDPEAFLLALRATRRGEPEPFAELRCLCGRPVPGPGQRCRAHQGTDVVVLEGDPAALQLLPDLMTST